MDKLSQLEKIGRLRQDGIISEEEFQKLKSDILNDGSTSQSTSNVNAEEGAFKTYLTIRFDGVWLIFDAKTDIYINDEFHSSQSTKKGFEVEIPLEQSSINLKLILMKIRITEIELDNLDLSKNHELVLSYSNSSGKFESEYELYTTD